MQRIFHAYPKTLSTLPALLKTLKFSLSELHYGYPPERDGHEAPDQRLRRLAYNGLALSR